MGAGRSWGHQHWVNGGDDLEVKLKDYLDGATVLFDAAGNVVDGRARLAKGTVRISLGCENMVEDVERITSAFCKVRW